MTITEVLEEAVRICRAHGAKRVILFGSRAKGTATQRSDIDLAVEGVRNVEVLREEIEEIPTLYSFDLVDLDTCENGLLLEDIKEYGKKIL